MKLNLINLTSNILPDIRVDYFGRNNSYSSIGKLSVNGKEVTLTGIINDGDNVSEPVVYALFFSIDAVLLFGGENICKLNLRTNAVNHESFPGRTNKHQEFWCNDLHISESKVIIITESGYMAFDYSGNLIMIGQKLYNEEALVTYDSIKLFYEDKLVSELTFP